MYGWTRRLWALWLELLSAGVNFAPRISQASTLPVYYYSFQIVMLLGAEFQGTPAAQVTIDNLLRHDSGRV